MIILLHPNRQTSLKNDYITLSDKNGLPSGRALHVLIWGAAWNRQIHKVLPWSLLTARLAKLLAVLPAGSNTENWGGLRSPYRISLYISINHKQGHHHWTQFPQKETARHLNPIYFRRFLLNRLIEKALVGMTYSDSPSLELLPLKNDTLFTNGEVPCRDCVLLPHLRLSSGFSSGPILSLLLFSQTPSLTFRISPSMYTLPVTLSSASTSCPSFWPEHPTAWQTSPLRQPMRTPSQWVRKWTSLRGSEHLPLLCFPSQFIHSVTQAWNVRATWLFHFWYTHMVISQMPLKFTLSSPSQLPGPDNIFADHHPHTYVKAKASAPRGITCWLSPEPSDKSSFWSKDLNLHPLFLLTWERECFQRHFWP